MKVEEQVIALAKTMAGNIFQDYIQKGFIGVNLDGREYTDKAEYEEATYKHFMRAAAAVIEERVAASTVH